MIALLFFLGWIVLETYKRGNLGLAGYYDSKGEYHRGKTLWDWAELLIIPVVLAIGAWWLNKSERENEQKIADDRRNQATLEAYFDCMVELLVEHNLLGEESEEKKEILSTIARTRTLAVLRSLDGKRKGQVVQFLFEAGLLGPKSAVVWLEGADLRGGDLEGVTLIDANLTGVNLHGANVQDALLFKSWLVQADLCQAVLKGADLRSCNLSRAELVGADLRKAVLEGDSETEECNLLDANLDKANLKGALVSTEQLRHVRSLKGATLPNGTVYHGNPTDL